MYHKNIIIIKTCVSVIRCKNDDKKIELFREIKRKYSDNIFIVNTIFCENNMGKFKPKYRCENNIYFGLYFCSIYLSVKKES